MSELSDATSIELSMVDEPRRCLWENSNGQFYAQELLSDLQFPGGLAFDAMINRIINKVSS